MTRKRRYLICAAILAACVCIALGVLAMMPPRPGVTKANFDRIEAGMPIADVQEMLGRFDFDCEPGLMIWHVWRADDGAEIVIHFENDFVTRKVWIDSTETFVRKLRRWLHLPK